MSGADASSATTCARRSSACGRSSPSARRRPPTKERQLERYAADLRETFKEERARAEELRDSYVATVRALTNAVEARDAYTGKHAERVAAYGLELGAPIGQRWPATPRSSSASCCTTSARWRCPTRSSTSPSRSTPEERELMRSHPVIGWEIVRERRRSSARRRRRAPPPRALGRRRLPRRPGGRGHPAGRARLRRGRHPRRADHRPALPARRRRSPRRAR